MTPSSSSRAALRAVAAATPADRDRTVDLLRGVSLVVVALGHWLLASLHRTPDGATTASSALAEVPLLQPLTWLFQVMPLFFLVGGVANLRSWASATARGDGYRAWLGGRLQRLVGPTVVAVAIWTAVAALVAATGVLDAHLLALAVATVSVPLWFLAVYLLVVAAAPAMLHLHRRFGVAVPVVLIAAATLVDALHRAGVPSIGWVNFALVWLTPQQLGFLWADGRLRGRRVGAPLLLGGTTALVLATLVGPYPVSVVGVPGAAASNNSPPTVVLLALALAQLGAIVLAAPVLDRWLARPKVWAAVVVLNLRALTVYLWHLPVLVVVAATLGPAGLTPMVDPGTAAWWATRPVWLLQLLVVLAAVLPLIGRLGTDRIVPVRPAPAGVPVAAVACILAFALLAGAGLPVPGSAGAPAGGAGLAALAVGVLALRRGSHRSRA